MNKEAVLADIRKGKAEIAAAQDVIRGKIKDNFHEMAKTLFEKHDKLKSFGWMQYTPYFNDGEECTFSSHHSDPFINDKDEGGDEPWGWFDNGQPDGENIYAEDPEADRYAHVTRKEVYGKLPDGSRGKIPNPKYDPIRGEIVNDVKDFLNIFDDEDYRDLFDDHMVVIVTNDWIESQELEHG